MVASVSTTPLSQLPDWELAHQDMDIRGWPVQDASGNTLGTVSELLVDTNARRIDTVRLDNGQEFASDDLDPDFDRHVVRRQGAGAGSAARTASATGSAPAASAASGTAGETGAAGRVNWHSVQQAEQQAEQQAWNTAAGPD